eukprot:COSAG02_NODE_3882_length_6090_cov_26.657152_1_plen_62_part_10
MLQHAVIQGAAPITSTPFVSDGDTYSEAGLELWLNLPTAPDVSIGQAQILWEVEGDGEFSFV